MSTKLTLEELAVDSFVEQMQLEEQVDLKGGAWLGHVAKYVIQNWDKFVSVGIAIGAWIFSDNGMSQTADGSTPSQVDGEDEGRAFVGRGATADSLKIVTKKNGKVTVKEITIYGIDFGSTPVYQY